MNEKAKKLHDDIFYGRVYMCDKCRRKNDYSCSNAICLKECERMVDKDEEQEEQLRLF